MIPICLLYGNHPNQCGGPHLEGNIINLYDYNDLQDSKLIHLNMPEGLKLPNATPEYNIPVIQAAKVKSAQLDIYPPIQLLNLIKGDYILNDDNCKIVFQKNDTGLFKKIESIFKKRNFSIKKIDSNNHQLITEPINWKILNNNLYNNKYQISVGNENHRTTLIITVLAGSEHINPIQKKNILFMMTNELTRELRKFDQIN